MFAALMVARLREISSRDGLCKDLNRSAWLCADDVLPLDTPLARAAEVVCASVSIILAKTKQCMDDELTGVHDDGGMEYHLRKTKAAEVRVVKFQEDLKNPTVIYCAEEVVLS